MKNDQELQNVITLWEQVHQLTKPNTFSTKVQASDLVASFFCPGDFYYFILNFFDLSFEYVHSSVEKIVGCSSEEFNFGKIFEKMHPDDLANIKWKEEAANQFFYHQIKFDKIPLYKSTYTFRIQDSNGGWKNVLHQSIALQFDENRKINYVFCVHSDITFLQPLSENTISFIGLNDEPSYYALSTDPNTFLQKPVALIISPREKEIIKLMAEGLSSKQIADRLFISHHTVDTHRRHLLAKTGTKNTLELTVLCLKRGMV